ncbi:MAG: hypothetical protein ACKKL4_00775 [Patescibacteria group bacterium]
MAHTPRFLRSFDGRYTELVLSYLSDNVAATLYYHSKDAEPRVLAHIQKSLPVFKRHPSRREIIDESLFLSKSVCEEVLREAYELYQIKDLLKDDQRIDKVSCFLSVPWLRYEHYNCHLEFDTLERIDKDTINKELRENIPQAHMRVDRHIAPIFANGYATRLDVALSNKIRTLSFGVIESFARLDELETLYQLLLTELNIEPNQLSFYSVGNNLRAFTQAQYAPEREYVSAHIHGYSSDVVVVEQGEISYAGLINYGYYDFIDRLKRSGIAPDFQSVWSILAMRSRNELDDATKEQVLKVGKVIVEDYEQAIKISMADQLGLSEQIWTEIPRDWYVLGDQSIGRYFAQFLYDEDPTRRVVAPLAREEQKYDHASHIQVLHNALIRYRQEQSGLVLVQ